VDLTQRNAKVVEALPQDLLDQVLEVLFAELER
jgi:hypothetical protein